MNEQQLKDLYYSNQIFMKYVDRYCLKHNLLPNEAIKHELVKSYAESIMYGGVNYKNDKRTM